MSWWVSGSKAIAAAVVEMVEVDTALLAGGGEGGAVHALIIHQ
jgi:hypothetical protein